MCRTFTGECRTFTGSGLPFLLCQGEHCLDVFVAPVFLHLHFGDLHFKTPDHHAARRRIGKHRVDGFCEDTAAGTTGTEPASFLIVSAQLRGRILQRRARRVHQEKRIFIIIWRQ